MITDKTVFQARALDYLTKYCLVHSNFLIEDARDWAYTNGMDQPIEQRWWGAVTRQAEAHGIIENTGEFRASGKPKGRYVRSVWKSKLV